jgi:hypothetical protein
LAHPGVEFCHTPSFTAARTHGSPARRQPPARARLAGRGWTGPDGALTPAGRAAHAAVEQVTDQAAARPWARLGPAAVTDLAEVLTPIAQACARVVPYPSPIGVPAPGTVRTPA